MYNEVLNVLLQGEDVSMGIWMAAVGPQKYQVKEKTCLNESDLPTEHFNDDDLFVLHKYIRMLSINHAQLY